MHVTFIGYTAGESLRTFFKAQDAVEGISNRGGSEQWRFSKSLSGNWEMVKKWQLTFVGRFTDNTPKVLALDTFTEIFYFDYSN